VKPVYKKGAKTKARKYRQGGRGPNPDVQEATSEANRPNTPAAERPSRPATQSPSSSSTRLSYAEAKKRDPKLDSYIKFRKQFAKGSDDYNKYQNLINAAYGVKKRHEVKNDGKIQPKTIESIAKANAEKVEASKAKPMVKREPAKPAAPAKPVSKTRKEARKEVRSAIKSTRKESREDFKRGRQSRKADAKAARKNRRLKKGAEFSRRERRAINKAYGAG